MDPIKLAAAGTGAVIVGGTGLGLHFFVNSLEPVWYSLSSEAGFSDSYSTNVGKDYGNYLVGVYGDKGDEKNRNQKWWEWSYKQFQYDAEVLKEKLSKEFFDSTTKKSKVSGAYKPSITVASADSKALNEVCQDIYKKGKEDVVPDNVEDSDKSKLSRDMWKYCSHLGTRPVLLKENDYESKFIGSTHKDKAVSVKASGKDSSNDEFWRLRNDEFFGGKEDGKGNDASADGLFKVLYDKKKENTITSEDTVKKACEQAYSRDKSKKDEGQKVNDDDIKKFCYLVPEPNN
ncbi:hypothetical protein [Candidatus Mycoplasma haematohominis]|uniref:Uncharacterized protein n=1 Tax=Candidatus Mycoplasma haematohominis TaxID=1494318 RepID=A0A478FSV6_9MOLU|nr:hypothetical protein [Candidatus Mycoplasma haemohominis]GCE63466.1 hypothetical protein MHSWG343_04630 [Candidatus Mycoplasma haemohominis]